MDYIVKEERNLSTSETTIMKAIWDAKKDVPVPELIELLNTVYKKDYARTTVVTFLLHLSDKGFVTSYRKGRLSYVHPLKSEDQYKEKLLREATEFWYEGKPSKLVATLCKSQKVSKEEADAIREILNGLDY